MHGVIIVYSLHLEFGICMECAMNKSQRAKLYHPDFYYAYSNQQVVQICI